MYNVCVYICIVYIHIIKMSRYALYSYLRAYIIVTYIYLHIYSDVVMYFHATNIL